VPLIPRSAKSTAALSIIFCRASDVRGMFYDAQYRNARMAA
jgi:hypothetical protein